MLEEADDLAVEVEEGSDFHSCFQVSVMEEVVFQRTFKRCLLWRVSG